jgi:protein gp37
MAETTIEWTATTRPDGTRAPGYSFNPWIGCTKISPACDFCYAERWSLRMPANRNLWQGERRRTAGANWRQPIKWNREAAAAGERRKVFCASLADVFDNKVPARWRDDLWHLIDQTPNLDWLLLTKRPQNIAKMLPTEAIGAPAWGSGWPNVWLGTTVENQEEADRRIPHLLAVPAVVRFLSCEPILGPVDLRPYIPGDNGCEECDDGEGWASTRCSGRDLPRDEQCPKNFEVVRHEEGPRDADGCPEWIDIIKETVDWVIIGGESGGNARPSHPDWFRSLRDQCAAARVPLFFKQHGEFIGVNELRNLPGGSGPGFGVFDHCRFDPATDSVRVGKARAGRLLDGIEHNGFPMGQSS